MNNFRTWLVEFSGVNSLWVAELFLIVLVVLSVGYILNKIIDRLEERTSKTKTVWDDALIEACRRPAIW